MDRHHIFVISVKMIWFLFFFFIFWCNVMRVARMTWNLVRFQHVERTCFRGSTKCFALTSNYSPPRSLILIWRFEIIAKFLKSRLNNKVTALVDMKVAIISQSFTKPFGGHWLTDLIVREKWFMLTLQLKLKYIFQGLRHSYYCRRLNY